MVILELSHGSLRESRSHLNSVPFAWIVCSCSLFDVCWWRTQWCCEFIFKPKSVPSRQIKSIIYSNNKLKVGDLRETWSLPSAWNTGPPPHVTCRGEASPRGASRKAGGPTCRGKPVSDPVTFRRFNMWSKSKWDSLFKYVGGATKSCQVLTLHICVETAPPGVEVSNCHNIDGRSLWFCVQHTVQTKAASKAKVHQTFSGFIQILTDKIPGFWTTKPKLPLCGLKKNVNG